MAKRQGIPKKIRFEVLKRDKFTCQYCGRQAPDVVLNIDHIRPVSKGGTNDITNLVTSCFDCNSGKSDTELSDDTAVMKQKAQLDMLQERREQLEMMLEWQMQLTEEFVSEAEIVSKIIERITGRGLSSKGMIEANRLVKQFGLEVVCDATRIAFSKYKYDTSEEFGEAFCKIGGICWCRTHRTCYQCKKYVGRDEDRHGGHICEGRVNSDGEFITFWSVKDAESCESFEGDK